MNKLREISFNLESNMDDDSKLITVSTIPMLMIDIWRTKLT